MADQKEIAQSSYLPARLAHPSFRQPKDGSVKVWRYMSLPKLISLIDSQRLYLTRLDKMSDRYEGSVTKATAEGIKLHFQMTGSTANYNGVADLFIQGRAASFVSCWHANEHESEAMWRLYGGTGGVAVQTTYSKLAQSVVNEYEVYIGLVRYIDYEKEWFPDANAFTPIMHKRKSFEHEREVRLVWYWGSPTPPETVPESLSIPWDVASIVENIFVDPTAPPYYFEAVNAVLKAMSPPLAERLQWSRMKADPFFKFPET